MSLDKPLFRIPDTLITYKHLMLCAGLVLILGGALAVGWSYYQASLIKPPPAALKTMISGVLPETLIKSQDINTVLDAIYSAAHQNTLPANSAFTQVTDELNTSLLGLLVTRLSLNEAEAQQVLEEYYQSRSVVIKQIHEVMQSRKANLGQPVHSEITHPYYDSVNDFVESISGHACMFVSFPVAAKAKQLMRAMSKGSSPGSMANTTGSTGFPQQALEIMAVKEPCKFLLTEGLHPVARYLREEAIIKDINIIKFTLEERLRKSLLHLATAEDTYQFGVHSTWRREVTFARRLIGDVNLDTTISARATAHVRSGFDLARKFEMIVQHESRRLIINLPEPEVLSNEVSIRFGNAEQDFLAPSIESEMYNELNRRAKRKAGEEAENGNLKTVAKHNAYQAIMNIFSPMMALPQFNYRVEVAFNGKIFNKENLMDH